MKRSTALAEREDYLPWVVDGQHIPDDIRTVVLGSRTEQQRHRALGAVLFTDIVASTEKVAEMGDRQWRDLLEAHNALVRREFVRYGGREIDSAGDGFVATFAGPSDAIACAAAAIEAVHWIGIDIRAGVHAGEFELLDGKPAGLAMNIGARIAAMAGPGEIHVSETVRQLVLGSEITFRHVGHHDLKGVPGSWDVFTVTGGSDLEVDHADRPAGPA